MGKSIRLTQAREQYERHLRARGLAERTVKNSSQIVGRCVVVWGDILLSSVTPGHIDRLFSHYGWAPSTRNLYLSQLDSLFRWARANRWMAKDHSPTDGWRAVRVPKTMRTRVPLEDFPALLDAAEHPRDRAVIAVGLFTFLRGSEMRTLRIDDLDLGEHRLAIYRHKTKQPDVLPVSSELHAEMLRWLNWYRADQGGVLRPGWHLLPAKFPNYTFQDPVTRRIAVDHTRLARLRPTDQLLRPYEVVKRALARLDYPTYWEGEHTLRRSGARALADTLRQQGYDGALMRVASMLGHANTRVTEQYIGWDIERERRNADIAGKPMFPTLGQEGIVIELREAQ